MNRPQISTTGGVLTVLAGFLAIYQDIKITDFFTVFQALTFGELVTMALPFVSGMWMFFHDEKKPKVYKLKKR